MRHSTTSRRRKGEQPPVRPPPVMSEDEEATQTQGETGQSEAQASDSQEIVNAPLDQKNKWSSFKTRLIWTLVLLFSFFGIIGSGHLYCAALVMVIMITSFREITELQRNREKEQRLKFFNMLRYYCFLVTLFGSLYGYVIPVAEMFGVHPPEAMRWTVENHTLVTYLASLLGTLLFIVSLRRHSLRYQFGQFAQTCLTCLIVVAQGTAHIKNISHGLIWFVVPTTAVICNDIAAYLCGVAWGRTKLIPRISPKKTVEGFFGAAFFTALWVLGLTELLSHFSAFICPEQRLSLVPFEIWWTSDCGTPSTFAWTLVNSPWWLQVLGYQGNIWYKPVWLHGIMITLFASFVAPLGGLLASAYKRSIRVKDFANIFPGHGGVTDRFDCQLLMGMCMFLYLRATTKQGLPALARIMRMGQTERVIFFNLLAGELQSRLGLEHFSEIRSAFCSSPPAAGNLGLLVD